MTSPMNPYLWLLALHIISFTAWMAGMFYLPRLFVYHTRVTAGSEADMMLQVMEKKLLRFIMLPAMLATFGFGFALVSMNPDWLHWGWLHVKGALVVVGMGGLHGYFAVCRKGFVRGENRHSERFYRLINEAPTVLFVIIVLLAVLKPF